MSGHSKWASIKHKKAATDAKKGQVYTKLIREITCAAREGGGNPDINIRLRAAMAKAKQANMPLDNVTKAVKRGTGELPGISYESVAYEAYGPCGVAIIIQTLTDNKNRTSAEIRNILSKKGGNLAGAGSVNWLFSKKGFIVVDKKTIDEDKLLTIILEAGAEDLKGEGEKYEITTQPQDLEAVKKALSDKQIAFETCEITMFPSSMVKVNDAQMAKNILALVEALEDHDDAQGVYANFDIPDELLDKAVSD
ncbi:MAG: YebC/PmpR family DNA-binding transcriptional regulator [Candidatus Omnitrophica bacterium]|nr:YebC/PmpR family DNA-binding transcriptional regulator [Candidatus Omnitrophota bacterium]